MHMRIALDSIYVSSGLPLNKGVDNSAVELLASTVAYTKVPHWHVGQALKNTHLPATYWRSVGGSHNGFFMESFIDELAFHAGADPLEFRRSLTDRKDVLGVLDTLQAKSGWGTPLPKGHGRGISVVDNHGGVMGTMVEVSVSDAGELRIERVVGAVDTYNVVNPQLVTAQAEGGFIFGMTAALYGAITLNDGVVEQSNFHDYPLVRMAESPRFETHLCPSGGTDDRGRRSGAVPGNAPWRARRGHHQRDLQCHRQARAPPAGEERGSRRASPGSAPQLGRAIHGAADRRRRLVDLRSRNSLSGTPALSLASISSASNSTPIGFCAKPGPRGTRWLPRSSGTRRPGTPSGCRPDRRSTARW